ncbi:hypothetical protein SK069_17040 [Patulibacter brassicae]|jgi:hypothetical protein|uniref:Uncharacterized protein n=1 Tax=Patulibacter brassicae TaxID=1705717 RepID=A0ABU4VN78_9ACTN|nr:hypothetical protein [Patulibacter brassicae]MDX8153307.1 hypothetical protein [Patulibacter brassicae]
MLRRRNGRLLVTILAVALALSVALLLLDGVARCVESAHAFPALLLLLPVLLGRPLAGAARWLLASPPPDVIFRVVRGLVALRGRTTAAVRGGRLLGSALAVRPPPASLILR